ncbi:hypothetical protein [Alkalicoccus chagannorensis]|uniref:hypothetical protein n=1 Tax=Alkalicoccus chagannorensis TaxID=427072 RepID=UPI0004130F29|nr:hypothetical protein [Alkalicoccus chagannorensis]
MIEWAMITLLAAAVLLFVFSFFSRDRYKTLAEEAEEREMRLLQELYIVKKRIEVLEKQSQSGLRMYTRDDLLEMQEEGSSLSDMKLETGLSEEQIEALLDGKGSS